MAKKKKASRRKPAKSSWLKSLLNKYFIVFLIVLGFCGGIYCLNSVKNTRVLGTSTTGETTYEKCTQQKPELSVSPKTDTVSAGDTVKYAVKVSNKNCVTTEFYVYGKVQAGWQGTFDRNSDSNIVKITTKINAFSPKTFYFYVNSPKNVSSSTYKVEFTVIKNKSYLGDAYFKIDDSAKYVVKKADSSGKNEEKPKASAQQDNSNKSNCKPKLNYIKPVGHTSSVDYYLTVENTCNAEKDIVLDVTDFSAYDNYWTWSFANGKNNKEHVKSIKAGSKGSAVLTVRRAVKVGALGQNLINNGKYSFVVKAKLKNNSSAYDTVRLYYTIEK